ncbi:MAG: DNA-binding response regulator [Microbacteriaceae bacterium]|jgi:DNA-binding LytR/AlgR family response regulator|nr:DNA-binding response regulator [Microbacteriaceae bacterium]HEV7957526.1 LytTR family DNA-binding domain-containing protein [Marisediminicola sp.]
MIRIAIVEDEPRSMQLLLDHLSRYQADHGETLEIRTFTDGRGIASPYLPVFDVVFLDVEMEHLDGFSTARRIREVDPEVVLVFITNMAQFAIRGYEVDALSYLLKPVPYFAFSQELRRSIERASKRERNSIMLSHGGELARVDVAGIVYLESVKHRLVVHTLDKQYSFVGTLKEMEATLAGNNFFRSNSCYLVNFRHVTGVKQNSCQLVGGRELQISRPRKKAFLDALTDYVGGRSA